MHALKSAIEIIENHMLESEYPLASLEQRVEQLKGSDANRKHRTPASILTQHRLERRKRKRSIKKQRQNGMKKIPSNIHFSWYSRRLNNMPVKLIHEVASHSVWHGGPCPNYAFLHRSFIWGIWYYYATSIPSILLSSVDQ